MAEPATPRASHMEVQALERGRSEGFATAAIALGALSFIHLLGAEKAILAIVLAVLALRSAASKRSRARSWAAIGLSVGYLAIAAATLIIFHDKLGELIHLLQSLS